MWIAVRERFRRFVADLALTPDQVQDGVTKFTNIGRSLERAYYGGNFGDHPPAFMVGSWGKGTQVRPPRDLDCFFIMPPAEKARFDARSGNVQSALLQEVKESLAVTYPTSRKRSCRDLYSAALVFSSSTWVSMFNASAKAGIRVDRKPMRAMTHAGTTSLKYPKPARPVSKMGASTTAFCCQRTVRSQMKIAVEVYRHDSDCRRASAVISPLWRSVI